MRRESIAPGAIGLGAMLATLATMDYALTCSQLVATILLALPSCMSKLTRKNGERESSEPVSARLCLPRVAHCRFLNALDGCRWLWAGCAGEQAFAMQCGCVNRQTGCTSPRSGSGLHYHVVCVFSSLPTIPPLRCRRRKHLTQNLARLCSCDVSLDAHSCHLAARPAQPRSWLVRNSCRRLSVR